MKLLHIITDTNIGGAGKLLVAVLKNIDKERFDIAVAVPGGSALIPLIDETGVRVIKTEYGRDKSFEGKYTRELRKIIRAEMPDIVHCHASLSGRIAAWQCGVKVRIMTRHSVFELSKSDKSFPKKQLRGLISNVITTHYIATAEAAKRLLIDMGCDEKKITVIKNGSEKLRELTKTERDDMRDILGIPRDAFVVGISARLEAYKGHKYLLDALGMIGVNNIYLLVVGDGSEMENLKKQAAALEISDRVIFAGFKLDMAPYYAVMDVGVNCSYGTETTPLAITEAMALGVPSIASDFGGNPDTVTDGYDGVVIPQKDSARLCDAILSLYNDREKLAFLSANAKKSYDEKYSAKIMTEKYEKLYINLFERRRKK